MQLSWAETCKILNEVSYGESANRSRLPKIIGREFVWKSTCKVNIRYLSPTPMVCFLLLWTPHFVEPVRTLTSLRRTAVETARLLERSWCPSLHSCSLGTLFLVNTVDKVPHRVLASRWGLSWSPGQMGPCASLCAHRLPSTPALEAP